MRVSKLNLDHVVVVVPDLLCAIEDYSSLGFTVINGGDNGPTHNALIPFEDGTYIELITTKSKALKSIFRVLYRTQLITVFKPFVSPLSFRFYCWLGGENGIRDWCIKQESLDKTVDALANNEIRSSKIEKFTRVKPTGEKIEWLLAAPIDKRLPFFIEDIPGAEVRIPCGDETAHCNGYIGVSALLLDESHYSSSKNEIVFLQHLNGAQGCDSVKKTIRFGDSPARRIRIELLGGGPSVDVLSATENGGPIIECIENTE